MTGSTAQRVTFRRVRVLAGADPLAARTGTDGALRASDLRPPGLPPAAVLVVRSLADPLPGELDLHAVVPSARWESRLRGALADRLAGAARPATRPPGANAEAVLFADWAELLACLGRDRSAGEGDRWWWRALGFTSDAAVIGALVARAEVVPAAVARLDEWGIAPRFFRWLPAPAAEAIGRAVTSAFGTPAPAPPAQLASSGPAMAGPSAARSGSSLAEQNQPAADPDLLPAQRALDAICRRVHRAPGAVRPGSMAALPAPGAVRRPHRIGPRAKHGTAPGLPTGADAVGSGTRPSVHDGRLADAAGNGHDERPLTRAESGVTRRALRGTAGGPPTRRRGPARAPRQQPARSAIPVPVAEVGEAAAVDATPTELGGVFHLVLVAQRLRLYGGFTEPARPGIRLPVWDFVDLVGRRLLPSHQRRDPVWGLLARLAGRPPARRPGSGFRPPRSGRLPRSWLIPFDDPRPWTYTTGERLRLWHPAGFPVVDAPGADLVTELRRYRVPRAVERAAGTADVGTACARWADGLASYVRARLAIATGVGQRRVARLVLHRPATVHVSATDIDVVSELADLPIQVRLAGLDRDVGFVPAAGRRLSFHFR